MPLMKTKNLVFQMEPQPVTMILVLGIPDLNLRVPIPTCLLLDHFLFFQGKWFQIQTKPKKLLLRFLCQLCQIRFSTNMEGQINLGNQICVIGRIYNPAALLGREMPVRKTAVPAQRIKSISFTLFPSAFLCQSQSRLKRTAARNMAAK